MKRYDPRIVIDEWTGDHVDMCGRPDGEYVTHEDVCTFLKDLLNSDLDTLIEKIEEELKNA